MSSSRDFWAPVLVNLGIGVPAIAPLSLVWWLATEYLPMDCTTVEDLGKPDLANCDYHTLDHAPFMMILLALTGLFVLVAVVLLDVVLPRGRGWRRGPWLGAALLIPVPFLVALGLA